MAASRNSIRLGFKVEGLNGLRRAARALGEEEMPYLRGALLESASLVAQSARGFAKGGIASAVAAPRMGASRSPAAKFDVRHPGSRSMEFGRVWYWRGFKRGRGRIIGGRKVRSTGQKPRPYIGIVNGDAAVGSTSERVKQLIADAVSREWDRLGGV